MLHCNGVSVTVREPFSSVLLSAVLASFSFLHTGKLFRSAKVKFCELCLDPTLVVVFTVKFCDICWWLSESVDTLTLLVWWNTVSSSRLQQMRCCKLVPHIVEIMVNYFLICYVCFNCWSHNLYENVFDFWNVFSSCWCWYSTIRSYLM